MTVAWQGDRVEKEGLWLASISAGETDGNPRGFWNHSPADIMPRLSPEQIEEWKTDYCDCEQLLQEALAGHCQEIFSQENRERIEGAAFEVEEVTLPDDRWHGGLCVVFKSSPSSECQDRGIKIIHREMVLFSIDPDSGDIGIEYFGG